MKLRDIEIKEALEEDINDGRRIEFNIGFYSKENNVVTIINGEKINTLTLEEIAEEYPKLDKKKVLDKQKSLLAYAIRAYLGDSVIAVANEIYLRPYQSSEINSRPLSEKELLEMSLYLKFDSKVSTEVMEE